MAKMRFRWPFDSLVKQVQTRALGTASTSWPTKPDAVQFPHGDRRVLHAPGACEYCDHYGDLQTLRLVWGINFTGQYEVGKYLCPSEYLRRKEIIERWPGNQPKPPLRFPTTEEVEEARSEVQRMLEADDDLT